MIPDVGSRAVKTDFLQTQAKSIALDFCKACCLCGFHYAEVSCGFGAPSALWKQKACSLQLMIQPIILRQVVMLLLVAMEVMVATTMATMPMEEMTIQATTAAMVALLKETTAMVAMEAMQSVVSQVQDRVIFK